MNLQDFIGTAYLLWPFTIFLIIVCILFLFLFIVSASAITAGLGISGYYLYIYLKEKGFFTYLYSILEKNTTLFTDSLKKNIADTFDLQGFENIQSKPCLYLAHPHGLFSMAPFVHWGVQLGTWPSTVPLKIAIHSIFFRIPIIREIMQTNRCIEAKEDTIRDALESGYSVAVLTGGVQEIHETEPGQLRLVLKKRQGVLRIAKEVGVPIVPILTFGENELFPPVKNWWVQKIQTYLHAWFHIAIPLPTWESLKNWFSLLQGPLSPQVTTCIGHPILPKKESVEGLRKKLLAGFEELYTHHKPSHYPETLVFV